ncbi:hypothetical protein bsdcttw_15900 [Anaerocolumna chitinilytica]|uniref:Uncharacterized protein n=1 Tax=Anaerocolumna chitinilytica TaxID=1727145 RepID=A0A7I8DJD7_9FIRM|nr:hypothetical protein bsdcttw_15900 [Anaerocolumna chitinilytica]
MDLVDFFAATVKGGFGIGILFLLLLNNYYFKIQGEQHERQKRQKGEKVR